MGSLAGPGGVSTTRAQGAAAVPSPARPQPFLLPLCRRPALIGNRRAMLLGGLAGAMCSCCAPQPAAASNWGYDCPGPDAWEGVCRTSVSQSPIDIPISTLEQSIRFNYPEIIRANVINNGHGSPQVRAAARRRGSGAGDAAAWGGTPLAKLQQLPLKPLGPYPWLEIVKARV